MPSYEYDKDYPFAAFITNLGKYNEGELVGEWVRFPTTADEMKAVFERIGIGQTDEFGCVYEEWFVTDYDCYVGGLYDKLGEYVNLDELNYLAARIEEMDRSEYNQFLAAMEMGEHTGSLQDIINLTYNLDCYDVYPDIEDHDDLGRYYIDELDVMQVPEHLKNYIDYESYGRDVALEEGGEFTEFGYVRDTGSRFYEEYDGDLESIPEEYRVMNFETEEPEEELTEDELYDQRVTASMEVAYEIDTFFRGYNMEYAAMFPDEVVQQIVLHEYLLKGDTADIKAGLHRTAEERDITDEVAPVVAALEGYEQKYGIVAQTPDLTMDDKMDMATDLAFDLDEFFRQHDPQYAAQHPEPHEQKELIADLLLEGKTAALREMLEEMAQTGDDVLPGRIAEYERETGYDPNKDNTVLADRAKLVEPETDEKREKALALATEIDAAFRQYTDDYAERFPDTDEHREGIAGLLLEDGEPSNIKNAFINIGMEQGLTRELAPVISHISDFERDIGINTYSIYQLQRGEEMRDLRFEPLDRLHATGHTVDSGNYELVYSAPLTPGDTLESIYTEFNIERPDNFRGHSMSMSDVVVFNEYGKETAHYCDRFGFKEVPEFLVPTVAQEKENPLKTAEMTVEDDYGMIDGQINNGRRDEVKEKPSIRERLAEAKRECAERTPPEKGREGRSTPEHSDL